MGRTKINKRKGPPAQRSRGYFDRLAEIDKVRRKEIKQIVTRQYIDYTQHWRVPEACYQEWKRAEEDPTFKARTIMQMSRDTKIPHQTLSRWKARFQHDKEFRNYYYDSRGQWRRVFTWEEEEAIANFIRENYVAPGIYFTDEDFRELVTTAYLMKYIDSEAPPQFKASNGFIYSFKQHHGFSSRRAHYKRRPVTSDTFIQQWKDEIAEVFKNVPRDHIVNCDETSWKSYPGDIRTWAPTGSRDVCVRIDGDEKQCLTVLATIAADGTKRPLMFIAEGKTSAVLDSQLGDVGVHYRTHTETGWINGTSFMDYLSMLREHQGDDDPIHLICDIYRAHRTKEVLEHAEALGIHMHFIPAGCTDSLQPLDRTVFACLKATLRRLFRQKQAANAFTPVQITKRDSVQMMIFSWEHIQSEIIADAWDILIPESEE